MVRKMFLMGLFALVFLHSPLHSQEEQRVFAPFVSQLEAEIRNNLIRLSWKDAQDIRGPVYVYRSQAPFPVNSAMLSIPVEVPYGTGSYLDEADNPGTIYYFVVASDEWGRKYTLSIPYTNTISIVLGPEHVPLYDLPNNPAAGAVPGTGSSAAVSRYIEGLSASIDEGKVILSFSGADSRKNIILYRSLNPIQRAEDLLSALIIQQKFSSPFIDYPVPGIPYYYAVIYEEELSTGLVAIRPGYNATSRAVTIPQAASAVPSSRTMPLPRMNTANTAGTSTASLGSDAANAASSLESRERNSQAVSEVFPEDLQMEDAGEEQALRSIVQGYFILQDWEKAEEAFRRFLDLPRAERSRAKASFYLGQVYYFQGKSREALFLFLDAQKLFPSESNRWIQAVLSSGS
jgi:tetratricopeptide (TPR) repeat protein